MDTEQKNITLPLEVVDGRFTLEQVGAIVVLMGVPTMPNEKIDHWGNDPKFMPIVNDLVATGVAKAINDGDSVLIEIDLT